MNIGEVLIENIPQLWMGMVGILLNSIVVGTLFGKRKYDWFFPVICSVRFIIYNIGFLAIGNAMYGNETWYKITMSTFATVTALGVGIATAVLWQESLAKTLTGILAAECVNDGIVYQAISLNILPILEYMGVFIVFTILYFILRPLMKRYRSYQLKHEVVCLTGVLGFFGIGWFSNFLYNTSASLRERPMQMVADSFIIGGGGALIIAFSIYTIKIFKRKGQLEVNRKRMEEYYSQIQNQAGELEEIQNEMAVKLDELSNLSVSSKKEKKQKYRYYIEELKEKTGLDKEVRDYVMASEDSKRFLDRLLAFIDCAVPMYAKEGKSQLVISIGCTGGKHRSVTFAELIGEHLRNENYNCSINHRDIYKH